MKKIPLTQGFVALVDDGDYEVLARYRWQVVRKPSGMYAQRKVYVGGHRYRTILMHRSILGLIHGDGIEVDHRDGNGLNNQRANLRIATRQQNQQNKCGWARSGTKGVRRRPSGRWAAAISVCGRVIHLGTFDALAAAHDAYRSAALKHYGEFARSEHREGVRATGSEP